MKQSGLIIWIILLSRIALQAQCDVNYEETIERYCSGIYLIHQELDNQSATEATLILHGGNTYNLYLLNPSQSFTDFFLLSDSIDISGEFDIIEKGQAARYQIAVQQTREFKFSFLSQTAEEACVLLAIYLQFDSEMKEPAGLYRNYTELKYREPCRPFTHSYTKKRAGSLTKAISHYKLNIKGRDRKQIGEVFAFSDGEDLFINIGVLSNRLMPTRLFAKSENLKIFYYIEYYEATIVPNQFGTIYADSWQKKLIDKETGQIINLNRTSLKQIIKDDPELMEEFLLESNKSKKLKDYLVRYVERN